MRKFYFTLIFCLLYFSVTAQINTNELIKNFHVT